MTKNFALKLNEESIQSGDITFEKLAENGSLAKFQLSYCASGAANGLNLITKKSGLEKNHTFSVDFVGATASSSLSTGDLNQVYNDADGGDWDYVQAEWTIGNVNQGGQSEMYMIQNNQTYNLAKWPPKQHS